MSLGSQEFSENQFPRQSNRPAFRRSLRADRRADRDRGRSDRMMLEWRIWIGGDVSRECGGRESPRAVRPGKGAPSQNNEGRRPGRKSAEDQECRTFGPREFANYFVYDLTVAAIPFRHFVAVRRATSPSYKGIPGKLAGCPTNAIRNSAQFVRPNKKPASRQKDAG